MPIDVRENKHPYANNCNQYQNRGLTLNYTHQYVAQQLLIAQHAYNKLELGFTKLTVERPFRIAAILRTDVHELIKTEPMNAS